MVHQHYDSSMDSAWIYEPVQNGHRNALWHQSAKDKKFQFLYPVTCIEKHNFIFFINILLNVVKKCRNKIKMQSM